ncbi:MAG: hypothetical protein WDN76_03105 [Alphaproteobacteria bacterium]
MTFNKQHLKTARTLGFSAIAMLGLTACADYKKDFANINTRLDQLDTRVQSAADSAKAANDSATAANASATSANQRLDQMETRIQALETKPARKPRG